MGQYGHKFDSLIESKNKEVESIQENSEFVEFESGNFSNLLDQLSILSENNIIVVNEGKLIEFIKDKWNKFVEWIKSVWGKIKELFSNIKSAIIKKKLDHAWKVLEKYQWNDEDFDDLEDNETSTEESTVIKEDYEQVNSEGNIIVDGWGWGTDKEEEKDKYVDLKTYLRKNRGIDLEKMISNIESHPEQAENSEGDLSEMKFLNMDELAHVHFIHGHYEEVRIGVIKKIKKSKHVEVFAPQDVRKGIDSNVDQIIEDCNYISSLQPKVQSIINKLNSRVSKERTEENDSELINTLKFNIKVLGTVNKELLRMSGELNQGFEYFSGIADKVDALVAEATKSGKDFSNQISNNKEFKH